MVLILMNRFQTFYEDKVSLKKFSPAAFSVILAKTAQPNRLCYKNTASFRFEKCLEQTHILLSTHVNIA